MTEQATRVTVHGPRREGVPALEARRLTKHFPLAALGSRGRVVHAVDDISLALPQGTVTAVVGESGSGKSTLARLLTGLIKPTSGQLVLGGRPVGGRPRERRAYTSDVHLVLQDPFSSLNAAHSVRYHIQRPLKLHTRLRGAELEATTVELLERVSLSPGAEYADKFPHELSGGQRQRVAIARALSNRPEIIVADEPTGALDTTSTEQVFGILREIADSGRTVVVVTHDPALAARADRRLHIVDGKIHEASFGADPAQAPPLAPATPS
jgi:peptide/nickel transport system ATP-binding protein